MAIEVISTNQTTLYNIDSGDDVILLDGATLTSSGTGFFGNTSGALSLTVLGSVVAASYAAVLGANSVDTTSMLVSVGVTGSLRTVNANSAALQIARTGAEVLNEGQIIGRGEALRFFYGGDGGSLINSGSITATSGTAVVVAGYNLTGVGNYLFSNSGTISGSQFGINADSENLFVNNSGLIESYYIAIYMNVVEGFDPSRVTVVNSGTIIGSSAAIYGDVGYDRLTNTGEVFGDILLRDGADRVINFGRIVGDVVLGEAGDTYSGASGFVEGSLSGGGGGDILIGGTAGESMTGDAEADRLVGNGGDDTLDGGTGNDRLFGGDGADDLFADLDNDLVYGGTGADTIRGFNGNDILYGGDGDDLLSGGNGRDLLYGDAGRDTFVYFGVGNSTTTVSDTIRDFRRGEDAIDIDGLFSGDIAFVGAAAHSGAASVRVTTNASGNSTVRIDVNGDQISDMLIFVRGVTDLAATDFIL